MLRFKVKMSCLFLGSNKFSLKHGVNVCKKKYIEKLIHIVWSFDAVVNFIYLIFYKSYIFINWNNFKNFSNLIWHNLTNLGAWILLHAYLFISYIFKSRDILWKFYSTFNFSSVKNSNKYSRDCGWPRRPWPNAGHKKQKNGRKKNLFSLKKKIYPPKIYFFWVIFFSLRKKVIFARFFATASVRSRPPGPPAVSGVFTFFFTIRIFIC